MGNGRSLTGQMGLFKRGAEMPEKYGQQYYTWNDYRDVAADYIADQIGFRSMDEDDFDDLYYDGREREIEDIANGTDSEVWDKVVGRNSEGAGKYLKDWVKSRLVEDDEKQFMAALSKAGLAKFTKDVENELEDRDYERAKDAENYLVKRGLW